MLLSTTLRNYIFLGTQVDIYSVHQALAEASRLNMQAAAWSAVAAVCGAVTALLAIQTERRACNSYQRSGFSSISRYVSL